MAKEDLPKLNNFERTLNKSRDAVDVLTADAALLSSMFRTQLVENSNTIDAKEELIKEVNRMARQLRQERTKNNFQAHELRKKETLCLRAMAARKSIHESYQELKEQMAQVREEMVQEQENMKQLMVDMGHRDQEIDRLLGDLSRANSRIQELEEQKKLFLLEYRKLAGKAYNPLLEQFTSLAAASSLASWPGSRRRARLADGEDVVGSGASSPPAPSTLFPMMTATLASRWLGSRKLVW